MGSFLGKIGKGLLYLFVLPLFVVVIVIVMLIGLFGFIYLFIKQVILFFTGKSLYADLPEDIQLKALLEGPSVQEQGQSSPISQQVQPQSQISPQQQMAQGQPVINVHISTDPYMQNTQPFIVEQEPPRFNQPFMVEPEPERNVQQQPEIQPEPETIIPDPAPEVIEQPISQSIEQPVQQPQSQPQNDKPEEKIGVYHSGDPVFSPIDDDDIF